MVSRRGIQKEKSLEGQMVDNKTKSKIHTEETIPGPGSDQCVINVFKLCNWAVKLGLEKWSFSLKMLKWKSYIDPVMCRNALSLLTLVLRVCFSLSLWDYFMVMGTPPPPFLLYQGYGFLQPERNYSYRRFKWKITPQMVWTSIMNMIHGKHLRLKVPLILCWC